MSTDPHYRFRVRIDQLIDERDKALERERRQRRRAERWHSRAYALTKQVALLHARLQRQPRKR